MTDFERHLREIAQACAEERIDRPRIAALAPTCGPAEVDLVLARLDGLDDDDLKNDAGDVADYYWRLRTCYAELLAQVGERAVGQLIDALQSPNPRARAHVAQALGTIGAARAFGPLVAALGREADESASVSFLEALGHLRHPAAFDVLLPYLDRHDSNGWYARVAAGALGRLGDPRAVAPLARLLRTSDDWFTRLGAVEGLRHLNQPAAADALREATHDTDPRVQQEAAAALRELAAASR